MLILDYYVFDISAFFRSEDLFVRAGICSRMFPIGLPVRVRFSQIIAAMLFCRLTTRI